MILADTSIWVDHLRHGDRRLAELLTNGLVVGHPAVLAEVGLGSVANRSEVLGLLANLPQAVAASHSEVMAFVELHRLPGRGIGYVDAQLLAATALTGETLLWTRDRRLRLVAEELQLGFAQH